MTVGRMRRIIHRTFSTLYPRWPLGHPVKIGDFGYLTSDCGFEPRGNIFSMTGDLASSPATGHQANYTITEGASLTFDAKSDSPSVSVSFSREHTVLYVASDCISSSLYMTLLEPLVFELLQSGRWNPDWSLVWSTVHSENTVVAMASERDASLKLKLRSLETSVEQPTFRVLSLGERKGLAVESVCGPSASLFSLCKIKGLLNRELRAAGDMKEMELLELRHVAISQGVPLSDVFTLAPLGRDDLSTI